MDKDARPRCISFADLVCALYPSYAQPALLEGGSGNWRDGIWAMMCTRNFHQELMNMIRMGAVTLGPDIASLIFSRWGFLFEFASAHQQGDQKGSASSSAMDTSVAATNLFVAGWLRLVAIFQQPRELLMLFCASEASVLKAFMQSIRHGNFIPGVGFLLTELGPMGCMQVLTNPSSLKHVFPLLSLDDDHAVGVVDRMKRSCLPSHQRHSQFATRCGSPSSKAQFWSITKPNCVMPWIGCKSRSLGNSKCQTHCL